MKTIIFTVGATAAPAGSKSAFPFRRRNGSLGVRVVDANPKSQEWKRVVAWHARRAYQGPLLEGPLAVEFVFEVVRPKSHFGVHGLNPRAPLWPIVRPDVLKLSRAVEDAITGIIWSDDSQIVDEKITKKYGGELPLLTVTIVDLTVEIQSTPLFKGVE